MSRADLVEQAWQALEPELAEQGFELVEVEVSLGSGPSLFRLFIDRQGGVTLDDCAAVSQMLSPLLDKLDIVPGAYTLEVSSPGFDRPVRKPADFVRFSGERIRVKSELAVDGRKNFTGVLVGFEDGVVTVDCDGERHRIHIGNVRKANLVR